jgi:hypothetical protein
MDGFSKRAQKFGEEIGERAKQFGENISEKGKQFGENVSEKGKQFSADATQAARRGGRQDPGEVCRSLSDSDRQKAVNTLDLVFALILAGVWVVAAAAGLGFYHWWYTAGDKTLPVLGILGYLAVCMAASVLVSLVPNRPQVTALAVALMAAPLASTAAAAVLHGAYYFEWIARPVIGPVIG